MNKRPVTFVSFCVDIDRGLLPETNSIHRSFELYKAGMYENIGTNVPLVLYSSLKDLNIPSHRNEFNFKHYLFEKTTIESEFPNFELYHKYYSVTYKDEIASSLFYYTPLVVMKIKKMMEVVEQNPFDSEMFFWMDCFFLRGMLELDFLYKEEEYLKMYDNVKNKLGDKFVLLNWGPRPFGFFWGGNKKSLQNVYENYFDIFFEHLPTELLTEELILKIINEKFPYLMHTVEVEHPSRYKITCQDFLTK